jgi:type II secretory pathway predicted ATPase ExeA
MAKHHSDQRDALFESSEYLADVLTHCAFIEKHSYLNSSFSIKDDLGKAMTRLYTAILHYTAQIRKSQDPSTGRKLLDCVTAITEQPLTELKASVEKERDNIFRWIGLVKHLHHEKEAENILSQIDKLAESVQHLNEQLGLVNLRVAEGAFHDSYANEHEEFCLPDSRTELLSQILEWADSTEGQPIFWLNGVAGIGKSAIARIVARSLQDRGQLGATFFFKRDDADCGSARYLISTITRMLITRHRRLVPDVLSAIEDDPDISSKSLREQFDKLLFQPLLNLRLNPPITTVIVIDALDECDREDDIQVILRLLSRLQDVQSVRVRIFLTSRPELSIRLGLKQNNNHRVLVLHDLSESGIEHDIRLFLEHELSVIRDKRLLPLDWPGNENIEKLVKMAFPLFALAAIICRFIGDERGRPEKRLELLLQDQRASSSFQIGRTYLLILNQLLSGASEGEITQLKQEFRDIVGVIVLLATPLSVNALAQLIKLPRDDINTCLAGLHSVLSVGENIDIPVRILHSSFRDYLLLTESPFQVDQDEAHSKIASHCLRLMDTDLKHNICSLTSYGTQRVDIGNQVINQHIPAALEYACRYWVYHLQESKGRISESMVLSFLKQHFLHWLEVLSLAGNMSEAVGMVDALQSGIWVRSLCILRWSSN